MFVSSAGPGDLLDFHRLWSFLGIAPWNRVPGGAPKVCVQMGALLALAELASPSVSCCLVIGGVSVEVIELSSQGYSAGPVGLHCCCRQR